MNTELNVRSASLDADLANHRDGGIAHRLILAISKGLRGSDCDRIARVYSHRVEVFDRADDDDVVFQITHYLELVFLPAEDRFSDKGLVHRREVETTSQHFHQLFAVVTDAAATTAERK